MVAQGWNIDESALHSPCWLLVHLFGDRNVAGWWVRGGDTLLGYEAARSPGTSFGRCGVCGWSPRPWMLYQRMWWVWGCFLRDRKSTRLNSSHVKISYA